MSDPTRRILDRIGETTYLPVINVAEADAVPLLGLPILGLVVGSRIHTLATLPAALLGLVLGVSIVRAAPAHLRAVTWVQDVLRYYLRRPRVTTGEGPEGSGPDGTEDLAGYVPFVPDQDTRDLTELHRAWDGTGVIEREDGAFEGWIEVSPGNMDLATADDWATLQAAARQFANDELDFDLTLFATTRSFPSEEVVETFGDRLEDPEVQSNGVLRDLVVEYREQRPERLTDLREIRYFVGVEVKPGPVHDRASADARPLERLASVPVLGPLLFSRVVTDAELPSDDRRDRMARALDQRLRVVEMGLVHRMPGWSSRRLSALEVFLFETDFWNGTEYAGDPRANAHLITERPAGSRSREHSPGDRQ